MSMSEGTPPPPPYGGGQQGGQQPYGQPYGSQPPYGSPPPSGDPYHQPPAYGAPPPAPAPQPYGAPPGYPAPAYGQPYGAAPAYGAPVAVPGNLASMGARFGARLIDGLISIVVVYGLGLVLVGAAFSTVQTDPTTGQVTSGIGTVIGALIAWGLILFAFGLLYELVMIALKGATLGKMAVGVKVVREADGQLPGWGPSALRYLIQVAGSFVCGIGVYVVWLSPFFDNTGRRQGWHDKVAKTLVVRSR
jgi:uncharacterized RDD family membrane protein YckC